MQTFHQYIISVVAVCVSCGIIRRLVGDKSASSSAINVLCSVILAITIISPALKINISDLRNYLYGVTAEANMLIESGTSNGTEELREVISSKLGAYVLEKADLYDCNICTVEVVLSEEQIPTPIGLQVIGRFSPFARSKLSEMIETNLGIPKENQQWKYLN